MNQPLSLQSLTQKAAPTFEQPFEMMEACHQRLDRTLALLAKLRAHLASHGADGQAGQAARDVLRYFEQAAPNHHRDEELHVFPALLEQGVPVTVEAVKQLQRDHVEMDRGWEKVRSVLAAIADGRTNALSAQENAAVDAFALLYESHIQVEETLAYPAARLLLSEEQQREMGREMQARRGGAK